MSLNSVVVVVVVVVVVACFVYRTWDLVRARLSFVINVKTGTILATVGLVVWVIECVGPRLGGVGSTGQHSMHGESLFVVYYTSMQQSIWGWGGGGGGGR